MFQLALILVATVALGAHGQTRNYAAICASHTMSKYPSSGPSCGTLLNSGVGKAEIEIILRKHNELRSRIALGKEDRGAPGPQKPAANMLQMMWDGELATVAQRWADQCTNTHDTCRGVDRFANVGQNMHMTWTSAAGSKANWAAAINSWIEEVKQFNKSDVSSYKVPTNTTGHYTQLAWAETYLVGCGLTQYKPLKSNNVYLLYVCNYAPAGNIIGRMMYQVGTACSKCPANTTCSNGLCVP